MRGWMRMPKQLTIALSLGVPAAPILPIDSLSDLICYVIT
jgi:hypothetical protein